MANVFKSFTNNDSIPVRTLLHEAIPITGSIVSGSYQALSNIKTYSHGMFESVYDYPFLSSSANKLFDISIGYSPSSALSASTNTLNTQKINMYNQMAQVLMGYSSSGSINEFDETGSLLYPSNKMRECIFLSFSRLLVKDEIKKGSFSIALGASSASQGSTGMVFDSVITITDNNAVSTFKVNSPAGEYGILSASTGGTTNAFSGVVGSSFTDGYCGLLFYQAGIAVLTASILMGSGTSVGGASRTGCYNGKLATTCSMNAAGDDIVALITGSSVTGAADLFRTRIQNISFNNTTELNSTVYFCRLNNNEYNYSSNPTYLTGSKMVVKNNTLDAPVAYVTTIGLYSSDNELLAVGKLSECLKKDPTTELVVRCRLDYTPLPFLLCGLAAAYEALHGFFGGLFT